MKSYLVDTNILLDLILKREPSFSLILPIFQEAREGQNEIIILQPVILECEWVLRSYYKLNRDQLIKYLRGLIDSYTVQNSGIINQAIILYEGNQSVSFTDSVILAEYLTNYPQSQFLTNDQKLAKLV